MSQYGIKLAQFTTQANKFPVLVQIFDCIEELLKAFNVIHEQQVKDVKEQKSFVAYTTEGPHTTKVAVSTEYKYDGSVKTLQELGACIVKKLTGMKVYEADVQFPIKFDSNAIAQTANGIILENYLFNAQNDQEKWYKPVVAINVVSPTIDLNSAEFQFLQRSGECTLLARQLGTTRANVATPKFMMDIAKQIAAETNTKITCIVGKELEQQGFNLIYNVGKGSVNEPCIVNLFYNGNPQSNDVVAFIGKGICFDSGGLNIKTQLMDKMYMDKCGACTVLSAFRGAALLKLPVNISCTLGLAENSPDGVAYRPSDIIKSHNGLTVEIGNTDAEGRLALADAMSFTQTQHKGNIKQMIELSTLTGACLVALGLETGGLFSNDDELAKKLQDISTYCNEQLWRMPIFAEHRTSTKGEQADLNNIGKSPYGGACTAAAFLEFFVDKGVQWSHLDIAGPAMKQMGKAATGFGVRILLEFLKQNSKL